MHLSGGDTHKEPAGHALPGVQRIPRHTFLATIWQELEAAGTRRLDLDFIVLLVLINGSGLTLLAARTTTAMGLLLLVHLGLVAAFFVSLPYGKFVHATYRTSALIQEYLEGRREPASA
ncbi:MAG: hypothetical protein OXD34_03990 [bacterium]|nr:hypothetical protein [bacterium]